MLLEALSGKCNYPYFKGVYYGTMGECVIECYMNVAFTGACEYPSERGDVRIMFRLLAKKGHRAIFLTALLPAVYEGY